MKLDFYHPNALWAPQQTDLKRRLTGHLAARIGEYEGFGLHVLTPQDLGYQSEGVWITFTALPQDQAVHQLIHRFHATFHSEGTSPIGFTVDPTTTFESIDHLQGAIDALVGGY